MRPTIPLSTGNIMGSISRSGWRRSMGKRSTGFKVNLLFYWSQQSIKPEEKREKLLEGNKWIEAPCLKKHLKVIKDFHIINTTDEQ